MELKKVKQFPNVGFMDQHGKGGAELAACETAVRQMTQVPSRGPAPWRGGGRNHVRCLQRKEKLVRPVIG